MVVNEHGDAQEIPPSDSLIGMKQDWNIYTGNLQNVTRGSF